MNGPDTPSLAHNALSQSWLLIRHIRQGAAAIRRAGALYLPKYEAESDAEYKRRLSVAPWRPEFEDAIRSVSAKPFGKEVALAGEPSPAVKGLAEDIDGAGNNLHCFARDVFEDGVALGACGILVDYPSIAPQTLADERSSGARPYWVRVPADAILALRTERTGAHDVVTHLRFREVVTRQDGFSEEAVERIRVIEPGRWEVWERSASAGWVMISTGVLTLPEVPFAFFAAGQRHGQAVRPPLLDLADMQVELYRALSREDEILTYAGSPMLSAEGIAPPDGVSEVPVGPKTILYAPSTGDGSNPKWTYVQPDAANITEVRAKVGSIIDDMRRLGMQPMLPKTGGVVTATASGVEAAKAHSAVQAWAMDLKDTLEQAFVYTMQWMGSPEAVEVSVHTDFAVGLYGAEEVRELREARKARDLSQRTYWGELQRRGVLGPAFDPDEEEDLLSEEALDEPSAEDEMAAAMMPARTAGVDPEGTGQA